jgi:hypothetical protein
MYIVYVKICEKMISKTRELTPTNLVRNQNIRSDAFSEPEMKPKS